MNIQHHTLANGRWNDLTFFEQMANIGSEVSRTINWRKKNNTEYSQMAFERVLELMDFTIADTKNRLRLKELCRAREALVDYFVYDNIFKSSDKLWQQYFDAFLFAARVKHLS